VILAAVRRFAACVGAAQDKYRPRAAAKLSRACPCSRRGSSNDFHSRHRDARNVPVTCHAKLHARFARGLFLVNRSHREVVPATGVLLILLKIGAAVGLVAMV